MLATTLFCLFSLLSLFGIAALYGVYFHWGRLEAVYNASLPKTFVAFARFGGVLVALASKLHAAPAAAGDKNLLMTILSDDWGRTLLASAAAWFVWEVVDVYASVKSGRSINAYKAARGVAYIQMALMVSLRRLVNQKKNRICQTLTGTGATLARARTALQPKQHLYLVVESLALFLRELHREPASAQAKQQNFRIGLYVEENGRLSCWLAFDLNNRSPAPFKSYRDQETRFSLANEVNPPLIVRCINERRLLIVSDCAEAAGRGNVRDFAYFDAVQANYLKSMLAFPILDFMREDGSITQAAVAVDTDVPDHFREEDRDLIRLFMEEFAARLNFEAHLNALLH